MDQKVGLIFAVEKQKQIERKRRGVCWHSFARHPRLSYICMHHSLDNIAHTAYMHFIYRYLYAFESETSYYNKTWKANKMRQRNCARRANIQIVLHARSHVRQHKTNRNEHRRRKIRFAWSLPIFLESPSTFGSDSNRVAVTSNIGLFYPFSRTYKHTIHMYAVSTHTHKCMIA